MEFITNNVDTIIALFTMIVTWVLGFLSKKSPYINNNIIIIQNVVVGLFASLVYYLITKDVSLAITLSGIFADTGYNVFHNIQKLISDKKNIQNNSTNTIDNDKVEKKEITTLK